MSVYTAEWRYRSELSACGQSLSCESQGILKISLCSLVILFP